MSVLPAIDQSEFPRKYVPADLDLGNWDQLEPLFVKLREAPVDTRDLLEAWLLSLSELTAAIGQESSMRYIRMTCDTDDPELEAAYLHYVQEIMPRCEPEFFELSRKMLSSPALDDLPRERYTVLIRNQRKQVELYRPENIALQTEDETLSQQYQKACGEQTTEFEGQERTIPQITKFLEETDRKRRQGAWRAAVSRQMADREKMESIFDRMLELRHQMAQNAGFENFLDYQFARLGRFDYTVEDCEAFHRAVEKHIRPLRRQLLERRREQMGLDDLAPWDLQVDALGRAPLRPFSTSEELEQGADKVFSAVDPVFSDEFDVLRNGNLLDLESRKGKAPGGYQSTLDEARLPFIFMNATGRNQDLFTLLHEGGHAFHALAYRQEPLHGYRNAPIEFCEVASMGMEMMACERLDSFYSAEDAKRAREAHLEDVIMLLPWIMRVDAFQHWLYRNPVHSRQKRAEQWLALEARFGDALVEWPELQEWRECSWISKLHFFCVPLYYIEYGIAQLGALQLWVRYLADPSQTVSDYRRALALGNSRPLPELFAAAGLSFDFNEDKLKPLAAELAKNLGLQATG